jgi:ribosomal protein S18 acetylase RimI-like enzyme
VPSPSELSAIEAFLRRAPYLHAYELGDLDSRELPHTTWITSHPVDAVVLVYRGLATPTVVALAHDGPAATHRLLASADLPARFYAHLTDGLDEALAPRFHGELLGHHLKMGLAARASDAASPRDADVVRLGPADADEAVQFYAESYAATWFEPVSLERGPYVAIRDARGLAAVAGVHVYSPDKRVASLGNIATRPDVRSRGYAGRVTAALCRVLAPEVDLIGLNVRGDNTSAIACYRGVGFEPRHHYQEWVFTAR